ncbi:MAG: hypothetical protein ACRELX_03645 [Longimicrobiales bacterium]
MALLDFGRMDALRRLFVLLVLVAIAVAQARALGCPMGTAAADVAVHAAPAAQAHAAHGGSDAGGAATIVQRHGAPVPAAVPCGLAMTCGPLVPPVTAHGVLTLDPPVTVAEAPFPVPHSSIDLFGSTPPPRLVT